MFYILFFLILTYFILVHPETSLYYAMHGMTLWYSKMVPTLLPFMILSGTLVRMNLTEKFVLLFHPFIKRIFRCRKNVTYAIFMGFLCGFPMGAKVTSDLLKHDKITESEGEYLLSFNNNIGPVYVCSFVIPILNIKNPAIILTAMYGIPLFYGLFLRYTRYKRVLDEVFNKSRDIFSSGKKSRENSEKGISGTNLILSLDDSIKNSIESIIMLCGYMIIFNLLNILPHFFLPESLKYISPFLEITGGISINTFESSFYILILLPFGGLSCIAQTKSIIKGTSLSMKRYVLNKVVITIMTALFYVIVFGMKIELK